MYKRKSKGFSGLVRNGSGPSAAEGSGAEFQHGKGAAPLKVAFLSNKIEPVVTLEYRIKTLK